MKENVLKSFFLKLQVGISQLYYRLIINSQTDFRGFK